MVPKYLVIHTAAYDGKNDTLEDIIQWHKDRGFRTIGYHYYIRKDGTIRKGREDTVVGAHCKAGRMNMKSLGICFEGHHDYENWTEDQKEAGYMLCLVLMSEYNIKVDNVIGHREAYSTDDPPKTCPGKEIDMDEVRNRLNRKRYELDKKITPMKPIELVENKIDFDEMNIERL